MKEKFTKKRIFDIIQIGRKEDFESRLFDFIIVLAIIANSLVLVLDTFEEFAAYKNILKAVEIVTIVFFCTEYVLRIWTSEYLYPEKSKKNAVLTFLFSFDGIVDLMTILPFFFLSGFVAFRLLRVIRILHLFRINAAYDSFNVIYSVLTEKKNPIISSVFIILILMLASSLCMYSAEHELQPRVYKNAFSGMWWSLSTIFTVGYGDIYPITTLGRVLAIITTFLGVGAVAIPTGIISAGFVEHYTKISQKGKDEDRDTKVVLVEEDSPYLNKLVEEAENKFSMDIMVIIRKAQAVIPTENTKIRKGDTLIFR